MRHDAIERTRTTHDLLLDEPQAYTALQAHGVHDLLRDGLVRITLAPPRRGEYPGETPIEGAGAVARWVALHDQANRLRATVRPGDGVGMRHAQRAIHALFLYEHQLTPKTRRQARTTLWRRDRDQALPAFAERARWARCRCSLCQPTCQPMSATLATTRAEVLVRSA